MGYKPIIVVTGSMVPAIKVNSISIVEKCSIEDIKLNDIVMYKAINGMLITHRVIDITVIGSDKAFITKGDANNSADIYPVTKEQLQGKLIYTNNVVASIISEIIPEVGRLNTFAAFRGIIILLLTLGSISLIAKGLVSTIQQIYWIQAGSKRFNSTIKLHKELNELFDKSYSSLIKYQNTNDIKIPFKYKIKIARYRGYMRSELKSYMRECKKFEYISEKYRSLYRQAIESDPQIKADKDDVTILPSKEISQKILEQLKIERTLKINK